MASVLQESQKNGYRSKSIGVKDFIKVRNHFRADGDDPLDGGTLQKREGIIAGAMSWKRHEGAGSSKHMHLYQNIAFLWRKVKAILCKSANLSRKR